MSDNKRELIDLFNSTVQSNRKGVDAHEISTLKAVHNFVEYLNQQEGVSARVKGRKINLSNLTLSLSIENIPNRFEYQLYIPSLSTIEFMVRSKAVRGAGLKKLVDQIAESLSHMNDTDHKWPVFAFDNMKDFMDYSVKNDKSRRGYNINDEKEARAFSKKIIKSIALEYAQELKEIDTAKKINNLNHKNRLGR
jgi:hypothetical protein